jgi:ABC-type bacteriocin/lantibiotic exporter with double-glycine peptidase domain
MTAPRPALAALVPAADAGGLGGLLRLLLRLAHGERRRLLPALGAAAGLAGLALLPPWLLAQLIDRAFPDRAGGLAAALGLGLLGAALLDAALAWLRRLMAAEAGLAARRALLRPAFAAMLRLPADDPLARDQGVLGQTFEEVERLARGASEEAVEILLGLATALVLSVAVLLVAPRLGLVVLGLAAGLVALHLLAGRVLRRREAAWFEARSRHWAHLVEAIAYVETVRLNGAHRFAEDRFADRLEADIAANRGVIRLAALLDAAGRLAGGLVVAAIAAIGGASVMAGAMSLGDFVLFLAIGGALATPLLGLAKALDELQAMTLSHARLARLAAAPHEAAGLGDPPPPPRPARLELDRVTFRQAGAAHPVLDAFCCTIDAGERVALLGASGIGKSTLAGLLVSLRAPQGGRILLDGAPLDEIPLDALRARVMLVPHQIDVFTGSVAQNIALGCPGAARGAIEAAAEAAALAPDIRALPGGYDAPLGQGGIELSAGQRQRLGIARAILAAPGLLILDESTSALDPATEARVLDGLAAALPDAAILAITHRASVAARMDRTLTLDAPPR